MNIYDGFYAKSKGVATVGSMVVFSQGVADKKLYRRFNIEGTAGIPDDFASMQEVLTRRFKRWRAAQEKGKVPGGKKDESFAFLPDLLIVDGGKGHFPVAAQAEAQQIEKHYYFFCMKIKLLPN